MFQKAAANQRTPVACNFFPPQSQIRALPRPKQQAIPLSTAPGNATRSQPVSVSQNASLKRSASGLARALSSQGGFEEPMYPKLSNPFTSQQKQPATQAGIFFENEYFDEDDFGSDFELDMEDPKGKATVTYPDLSSLIPKTQSPRITATSSPLIPWSSSPVEHRTQTSNLSRFAFGQEAAAAQKVQDMDLPPHPKKRRTIPWLAGQKKEEALLSEVPSASARTPKSSYSWNISASAMKQQREQLRQKKLVKTNEATHETKAVVAAKRRKDTVAKVFLSEEQDHVLKLVVDDQKSIFFTGSAGTGKSVLLREIIMKLRLKHTKEPDRVAVTASTGLAACNIGGVTLHSFAGIGLGKGPVEELVKKIRRNQKARHRWMRTKILIIDEVSMVDGELYDKLEAVARRIRNNGRPFGGIQLVITGDFFQLPPVPEGGRQAQFAFNADSWNTTIEHTICLHKVFRQKDPEFAAMLNQMREGRLDAQSINKFRSLNRPLSFEDELEGTELFPTRAEVENANNMRMRNLQGETKIFEARDGGSIVDKEMRDKLLSNCMAPAQIALKKGAQVMLIKNIDDTLVNGSLGKVVGFMSEAQFDNYQENEENYYATQAMPPSAEDKPKLAAEPAGASAARFPVVRFAIADGSSRDLLCQRESWKIELPNGEVQASRAQVPLILAWALSIHKAQGQTLERVRVNLSRVFEKGQAYVALSRATSMAGLQVIGFDPAKVMAHESVRRFYASLSRAEETYANSTKAAKSARLGIADDEFAFEDEPCWEG